VVNQHQEEHPKQNLILRLTLLLINRELSAQSSDDVGREVYYQRQEEKGQACETGKAVSNEYDGCKKSANLSIGRTGGENIIPEENGAQVYEMVTNSSRSSDPSSSHRRSLAMRAV